MDPEANGNPEPSREELEILTQLGRLGRMVEQGMSPIEAALKLGADESSTEYTERNRRTMEEVERRLLSPEYMARFSAAMSEPDPAKKAQALADLKRENYATLDMEAFHRTISARNRQWRAEGILPPDAPV